MKTKLWCRSGGGGGGYWKGGSKGIFFPQPQSMRLSMRALSYLSSKQQQTAKQHSLRYQTAPNYGSFSSTSSTSSRNTNRRNTKRNQSSKNQQQQQQPLWALPFSVSPEDAMAKFRTWAIEEQGLNWFLQWSQLRIGAAYCPVWTLDVNLRFPQYDRSTGQVIQDSWKPSFFATAYEPHSTTIHVPGLSSYAGYNYQRSLLHPVHATSLVFLNHPNNNNHHHEELIPWDGSWMLRDIPVSNGHSISISVDPWTATKGTAVSWLQQELQIMAQSEHLLENNPQTTVQVQLQVVQARRVLLPTYFIDYTMPGGVQYRAFASGCDAGAYMSGVSHQIMTTSGPQQPPWTTTAATMATTGLQWASRNRQNATLVMTVLQIVGGVLARFLLRIPWIGVLAAGAFVGYRKLIQPWWDQRTATMEWERQRDHAATMHPVRGDDFQDTTGAEAYFQQNRTRILHSLSGSPDEQHQHQRGNFDWYTQWEQWARQQYEQQQQQQQQQSYYGGNSQQQQTTSRQRRSRQQTQKQEFKWDFDPNDPYSVLGLRPGATKSDISAAFRKQMMMYHPDMQGNASEGEKLRATERSKLITEAYRKLKSQVR